VHEHWASVQSLAQAVQTSGCTLLSQHSKTADLRQAWGDWISGLASWEWFVTMTFRDPMVGGTWTKPGWGYAKRAWREFVATIQPPLGNVGWVRCFEMQQERGVPHIHALVENVNGIRRMDMVDWCFKNYGIARILPYNPNLGAGYYLCKYLTKELADVDFSANERIGR